MNALHEVPGDLHGFCGGKDQVDTNCRCTDLVLDLRIHISSGATIGRSWTCRCCNLPVLTGNPLGQSIP